MANSEQPTVPPLYLQLGPSSQVAGSALPLFGWLARHVAASRSSCASVSLSIVIEETAEPHSWMKGTNTAAQDALHSAGIPLR